MPTYEIEHPQTGMKIRMEGDSPPSEADIMSAFESVQPKDERTWKNVVSEFARPTLEYGGAIGGAVLAGAAATPETLGVGTAPAAVAGAGLGYAAGTRGADMVDQFLGLKQPETLGENISQLPKDIATGAEMEMGGQVLGKALPMVAKGIGKVAKPVMGRLSGTGTANIEEALKGGEEFTKAMRGKTSGEEIVSNAKDALSVMKANRSSAYRTQLEAIGEGKEINIDPLKNKIQSIFKKFVRFDKAGNPDWERTAIDKAKRGQIEDLYNQIQGWGSKPGDTTPAGIDLLKRNIDDLYSESSNARSLITQTRKAVKDELVKNVPEYAKMTKGYEEATRLIKDIESGLMTRKQGISGRIVADQTLRRLLSSMRDNFALRKELVDSLGAKGGQDLAGQIAGYNMNTLMPHGLLGSSAGTALSIFNPKMIPVIASASPRVQGEFLRAFGRAAAEMQGTAPMIGRSISAPITQEN